MTSPLNNQLGRQDSVESFGSVSSCSDASKAETIEDNVFMMIHQRSGSLVMQESGQVGRQDSVKSFGCVSSCSGASTAETIEDNIFVTIEQRSGSSVMQESGQVEDVGNSTPIVTRVKAKILNLSDISEPVAEVACRVGALADFMKNMFSARSKL